MKKMLILFLLFSFSGCKKTEDDCCSGPVVESFILNYMEAEGVEPFGNWNAEPETIDDFMIEFFLSGKETREDGRNSDGFFDVSIQNQFRELAASFGDTSFQKPVVFAFSGPVLSDTIEHIHIYADKKYNEETNEQNSLDHVVYVHYFHPGLFVRNHYSVNGLGTNDELVEKKELVESFNKHNNLFMVASHFWFSLAEAPDVADTYKFTIEIKFTNGKQLSATTPEVSLKGK